MKSSERLAVLLPGMGAVATTFIAGVLASRRGLAQPVGSLTQMGKMSDEPSATPIRKAVPVASLDDLVFGGWDIFEENCYEAAKTAGVLDPHHLEPLREEMSAIRPMKAVFDRQFVPNLDGPNVKTSTSKMVLANELMADIAGFMAEKGCDRAVSVWCGSTETYMGLKPVHMDLASFEEGLRSDHPAISPSMIYAYAHIRAGVPFLNGAPNLAADCPALVELAEREGVPVAGKDFKTGQTLMKTILAPGLAARMIGINGWYSTNILGNRDGAVLDDPQAFRTKEQSKLSVLESICSADEQPELYGQMAHKVRIDYYPPRGDNKEGWDNIDIFGWMGYPMQIKVNFLCRDSILAAPLVLDLALLGDVASRAGNSGVQEWLSFYFKCPQTADESVPVHDLFEQRDLLFAELRRFEQVFASKAAVPAAE